MTQGGGPSSRDGETASTRSSPPSRRHLDCRSTGAADGPRPGRGPDIFCRPVVLRHDGWCVEPRWRAPRYMSMRLPRPRRARQARTHVPRYGSSFCLPVALVFLARRPSVLPNDGSAPRNTNIAARADRIAARPARAPPGRGTGGEKERHVDSERRAAAAGSLSRRIPCAGRASTPTEHSYRPGARARR